MHVAHPPAPAAAIRARRGRRLADHVPGGRRPRLSASSPAARRRHPGHQRHGTSTSQRLAGRQRQQPPTRGRRQPGYDLGVTGTLAITQHRRERDRATTTLHVAQHHGHDLVADRRPAARFNDSTTTSAPTAFVERSADLDDDRDDQRHDVPATTPTLGAPRHRVTWSANVDVTVTRQHVRRQRRHRGREPRAGSTAAVNLTFGVPSTTVASDTEHHGITSAGRSSHPQPSQSTAGTLDGRSSATPSATPQPGAPAPAGRLRAGIRRHRRTLLARRQHDPRSDFGNSSGHLGCMAPATPARGPIADNTVDRQRRRRIPNDGSGRHNFEWRSIVAAGIARRAADDSRQPARRHPGNTVPPDASTRDRVHRRAGLLRSTDMRWSTRHRRSLGRHRRRPARTLTAPADGGTPTGRPRRPPRCNRRRHLREPIPREETDRG